MSDSGHSAPLIQGTAEATLSDPGFLVVVVFFGRLTAYKGLATWLDIYDHAQWRSPDAAVQAMAAHGVETLFLETGNSSQAVQAAGRDATYRTYVLDFHKPSAAPVGSMKMLNQPAPGTSVTSFIRVAPSDWAFLVAAAISSTSTYASHVEGAPGMGCFMIPPPVPFSTLIIV